MNITLTANQVDFVQSLMQTGEYDSEIDVISEGLQLLQQRDAAWKKQASQAIKVGVADISAGRVLTSEESKAEMMKLIRNPVRIAGFKPMSREECNERRR